MELKLFIFLVVVLNDARLNRTFYGIETSVKDWFKVHLGGLNRTFYGIETKNVPQNVLNHL